MYRTTSDSTLWDDELTGPDGDRVTRLGLASAWELPATGTFTLSARALDTSGEPTEFTLRLRTATPGPAITAGAPARFVPAEPGRWVVSRIQIPGMSPPYGWRLEAMNAPATDTTWWAAATVAHLPCPFESTANGCGSEVGAVVISEAPSRQLDYQPEPGTTMLVIYDPGTSGSPAPIDLAIRST